LRRAYIHPLVLTGDQVATARAVADQLGLNGGGGSVVVDSAGLAGMPPEAIAQAARRGHVFARVSPAEKLRIVQALQQSGVITGMVGDGFNDSPALKAAHVGIAIGAAGTEAARDAADIVMQTEDLGAIATAIEQGRVAHANVRRATGYLVGTNLSEIAFVMAGTAAGFAEPLSAAQLLWINIVSDVLPGVGLSAEPPDSMMMERPPRSDAQMILGGGDMPRLAAEGSIIAAGALASAGWGALRFGGGPSVRTMGFGSLVLGQLLHTFNRRAAGNRAVPGQQEARNNVLAGALTAAFGAQAVALLVPGLRTLLGIAPLGPAEVVVTVAGGVLPFFVNRALRPAQSSAAAGSSGSAFTSAARSVASST
jgi:Ca2+-transporting ATPase